MLGHMLYSSFKHSSFLEKTPPKKARQSVSTEHAIKSNYARLLKHLMDKKWVKKLRKMGALVQLIYKFPSKEAEQTPEGCALITSKKADKVR